MNKLYKDINNYFFKRLIKEEITYIYLIVILLQLFQGMNLF